MNIREQLEELDKYLTQLLDEGGRRLTGQLTVYQARHLVKQLIAERPYEPGEPVVHGGDEYFFYCVNPFTDSVYVLRSRGGSFQCASAVAVETLPKTYRVKPVPEEIINDARSAVEIGGDCASRLAQWLANPDNLEADDE